MGGGHLPRRAHGQRQSQSGMGAPVCHRRSCYSRLDGQASRVAAEDSQTGIPGRRRSRPRIRCLVLGSGTLPARHSHLPPVAGAGRMLDLLDAAQAPLRGISPACAGQSFISALVSRSRREQRTSCLDSAGRALLSAGVRDFAFAS